MAVSYHTSIILTIKLFVKSLLKFFIRIIMMSKRVDRNTIVMWRRLFKQYRNNEYSRSRAYREIASTSGFSLSAVRYHLDQHIRNHYLFYSRIRSLQQKAIRNPHKAKADKSTIREWRKLLRQYLSQGLSQTEAFDKIGAEYGRTRFGIEYYLIPGRRDYEIRKAKESYLKYPEERKAFWRKYHAEQKRNSDLYKALANSLNLIFQNVFSESDDLSQKEIYGRLKQLYRKEEYSVPFDIITGLLPIEEVRPGYYRLKKN